MPHSRIETSPTTEIDDAAALSRVYTPGVADACREIAADPAAALAAQRAAAQAIGDAVTDDVRDRGHIVPDVFDEDLVPAVAKAVMDA
jgi:malic enzyme